MPEMTKKQKQDRKEKLMGMLWDQKRIGMYKKGLEHFDEIKQYKKFEALSWKDQQTIRKDWELYYKKVEDSTAYKRHQRIAKLWKIGRMFEVKRFTNYAHQKKGIVEQIPRPYGIDPLEYENNDVYIKYRYIQSELKRLETTEETDARGAFT